MITEDPAEIVGSIIGVTEKIVRFVTLEVAAILRSPPQEGGTPIKTGFARANWIPAVGEPHGGFVGTFVPTGEHIADESAALAGTAEVAQYVLSSGACWVTNNAPYIVKLNAGSSQQAPSGFVDNAVERAVNQAEAYARSIV